MFVHARSAPEIMKTKEKKHVLYWFWCYGHNFIADKKRQTARGEEDDDEKDDGKKIKHW